MWNFRPSIKFYEIKNLYSIQSLKGNLYSVKQDEVTREHARSILKGTNDQVVKHPEKRNIVLLAGFFIYLSRKPLLSNLGKNSNLKDDCIWCLLLCDTFLKVISG